MVSLSFSIKRFSCQHLGLLLFTVDLSGNVHYQFGLGAHISGFKLATSTQVYT